MHVSSPREFAATLVGKNCNGWLIGDFINNGKSAVVLKAEKSGELGAIKIFLPSIIEKYGSKLQTERIKRELTLKGHGHPNLVKILDGGSWQEEELHYIVMEHLPWCNLADALLKIPFGLEANIIEQIASAAKFLEELEICHRDIKPSNIAISDDWTEVKLLDLGVMKPMRDSDFAEGTSSVEFMATLQYSPPELLLRQEEKNLEGWRAITFYQIGGVIHDLIMREPLFFQFRAPFAVLSNAVQHHPPEISNTGASSDLIDLARACLLKCPKVRIELVNWKMFHLTSRKITDNEDIKAKILIRNNLSTRTKAPTIDAEAQLNQYTELCIGICQMEAASERGIFPPFSISGGTLESTNTRSFELKFERSDSPYLPCDLSVKYQISGINPIDNVVKIVGTSQTIRDGNPEIEILKELYFGIFNASSIALKFAGHLLHLVDQAQNAYRAE